ncbi:thioredoxin family protein [Candidatus Woesearchaeota archaeon]|nr:thioredoxin family protein [Candidatus Woesearchaeota archaeon]
MSLSNSLKTFFASKFNIYLVIILLFLGGFAFFFTGEVSQQEAVSDKLSIHFFYLPTCPHCSEQKPIYFEVKAERDDVQFFEHDASSSEGSQLFFQMARDAGLDTSKLGVPTIFVGKHALVGVQSKEQIFSAIDDCINNCKGDEFQSDTTQEVNTGFSDFELPFLGRTDLTQWSLPGLAVVLGLIDGFNPCAMWVLVYLIGLLIGVKDKKRIWVIVGSFVLASGVLYFLFMTAWINIFLLLGYLKFLTIIIGLVALGGGVLSLKEYMTTKGELTCKVGDEKSHEKTMSKIDRIISQPLSWAIVFSMIGLAFVINSVEFACSAAIPAVFTQILALSGISTMQNYLYIGLYTLFFMLDDLIIFGMAAFALGSGIGEKYAKYCKLLGGIIMTVLGLIMLFAPHLLR